MLDHTQHCKLIKFKQLFFFTAGLLSSSPPPPSSSSSPSSPSASTPSKKKQHSSSSKVSPSPLSPPWPKHGHLSIIHHEPQQATSQRAASATHPLRSPRRTWAFAERAPPAACEARCASVPDFKTDRIFTEIL